MGIFQVYQLHTCLKTAQGPASPPGLALSYAA
jgi:hypothetical protein